MNRIANALRGTARFRKWRQELGRLLEQFALHCGWRLTRLTAEERRYLRPSHAESAAADPATAEYLRPNHPRLTALRERYQRIELPVTRGSLWQRSFLESELDIANFRGDNPYVWQYRQVRSEAQLKYYLLLSYVASRDHLGLANHLEEDGAFGCWTFDFNRRQGVSRDLLDSINELNFLDRHLQLADIPDLKVVDIGAGYGRFAHRLATAFPNLAQCYCLDAVPESTYLCEFYLRFRDCGHRAQAVPLDEIEQQLPVTGLQLAVNIHSFSECPFEAVAWWLNWLASRGVEKLLIVPNEPDELLSLEVDGSRRDFSPLLAQFDYRLATREPVIDDPDVRHLTGIGDHFYLYSFEGARS